jgi:hypothetical protein
LSHPAILSQEPDSRGLDPDIHVVEAEMAATEEGSSPATMALEHMRLVRCWRFAEPETADFSQSPKSLDKSVPSSRAWARQGAARRKQWRRSAREANVAAGKSFRGCGMRAVAAVFLLSLAACATASGSTASASSEMRDWQTAAGTPPTKAEFAALVAACQDKTKAPTENGPIDGCLADLGLRRTQ